MANETRRSHLGHPARAWQGRVSYNGFETLDALLRI